MADAQQGRQCRCTALGIAGPRLAPRQLKQRAPVQGDGAEREAFFGLVEGQAFGAQAEITAGVVRWIGHQPQVGEIIAGPKSVQLAPG